MHFHNETPPLTGSIVSSGGTVVSKAVAAEDYQTSHHSATEFAASIVAARFRLTISTARLVCELAGIGGSCA